MMYTKVKPVIGKFILTGSNGVQKTKEGNYTNGHWLLKPEFITKGMLKRINRLGLSTFSPEDKSLWPITMIKALYIKELNNDFSPICVFRLGNDVEVPFNAGYISYLQKIIPDFSLILSGSKTPANIMSGDKKVGLLMVFRILK